VGNQGISGNSGISNSGKIGISKLTFTFKFPHDKSGNTGRIIGLGCISNSGKYKFNQALILCKSNIISGHFGNSITGIFGIIISIILNCEYKVSCLSFLHW
jgi:hypothetical protein